MKHITKLISAIVLAFSLIGSGCTTTSSGQRVVDAVVLQAIAQSAASTGSYIWLQSNPKDRESFVLAQKSLAALLATGSADAAALQQALSSLPVKQLQGTKGAVVVSTAVTVLTIAGQKLAEVDKQQVFSLYVKPIAQGLYDGLSQTLGN